jgi:hypothetical protein
MNDNGAVTMTKLRLSQRGGRPMRVIATGVACIVAAIVSTACGEGNTGCSLPPCPTVPRDLVGKKLSDVEDELGADNIEFTARGVDVNTIVSAEWGVCSTTPSAGQPIDGQLVLHIRHATCGVRKPPRG